MNRFEIYPAIDVRQGQVVRLQEGDPLRQTVFDADPVAMANRWAGQGARVPSPVKRGRVRVGA
jgi:phosphoribosylformimino-5-aminoimidazole carboxamide ribotide isomerase